MTTTLLLIDPQIDFCDPLLGALSVPGAERDMQRLANLIRRKGGEIDQVVVTLDSHHLVDIAHPIYWKNRNGENPDPFTLIRAEQLASGEWRTADPNSQAKALSYVEALERGKRYLLCIWPPHCLIGSAGHAVAPELFSALREWESELRTVSYLSKGENPSTEHYSAIQAEAPDPEDPSTQTNFGLIELLRASDRVLIGGEAGSHCVANTVRDLASFLRPEEISKLALLTDAISPVSGYETYQQAFIEELSGRGMKLLRTDEV